MSISNLFNRDSRGTSSGSNGSSGSSRVKKSAAIGAALVVLVGGFEGLRTTAYKDIVGVPTICYGETKGVKLGQTKTVAECKAMLLSSLDEHSKGMEKCLKEPYKLPDGVYVSFASLTYNIGVGAFCKSSVVRYANSGDLKKACGSILLYKYAGGKVVKGLENRRAEENKLCMASI